MTKGIAEPKSQLPQGPYKSLPSHKEESVVLEPTEFFSNVEETAPKEL